MPTPKAGANTANLPLLFPLTHAPSSNACLQGMCEALVPPWVAAGMRLAAKRTSTTLFMVALLSMQVRDSAGGVGAGTEAAGGRGAVPSACGW